MSVFFFCKKCKDSLPLNMGQIRYTETAVSSYHYTLRVIAEESRSHEFVSCLKLNTISGFVLLKL